MKKKISAIVAIVVLFLLGVVIASGIDGINKNDQLRKDDYFTIGNQKGLPPKRENNNHPPDNITELTGILECRNDSFYIENTHVVFGPDEMIKKHASPFDYDGDEIIETILGELKGLSGSSVDVKVYIEHDNNVKVVEINGMPIEKPPQALKNINGDRGDFNAEADNNRR